MSSGCRWSTSGCGPRTSAAASATSSTFYAEEVLAALLSKRTGRPVKIIEDRLESFVANAHSREQRIHVELAAKADGTITGLRGTVHAVLGGSS